ncbi:DUF6377 domain-containing protein [Dysgonomonas sp. 25]|uniref:DUF6377 domain-containing protein n=1 Tax=Dysgonomonas sp. 25 TaxID=2302933 RepID=UPI0013D4EE3C|nr:DUF6377 domain-containing protein [Dysgonomonas sp. 25]NDV69390.1 hypothetical protein [Dysgonomonas sp. 25]
MRKILIILLLCLVPTVTVFSSNISDNQLDSLLKVLDKTIEERAAYTAQKKAIIQDLENRAHQAVSDEVRFFIYAQVFDEYKSFQMDSALVIANKRMQLSEDLKHTADADMYKIYGELNQAEVMMVTGMYKEALEILNQQDRSKYKRNDEQSYLYHLYHSLYMLMAQYSFSEKERKEYLKLEYQYKDSILSTIDPDNIGYQQVLSSKLMMSGHCDEALELATLVYSTNQNDSRTVGMISYTISQIYAAKGDSLNQKKYLAISAINDLRCGVKEYMSLPELAALIYADGDISRSYNYMKCSLEDAIFCKARLRTLEISRMLPIINAAYDMKVKQEWNNLIILLIIIITLVVVLVISLLYIYKKLKELAATRRSLRETNKDLKQINEDLNDLNKKLSESDHVKEEYIGYVFTMCSSYIDKLDDFRKRVNRKIKANQTDELLKQTSSASFVGDELKEFYKSFDTIFLNIYPDFIEEFNSLLCDDEHVTPKDGELLSPELRIYALVKLGISDSVKIASFLHYSTQTVYNYRLKIRNKAKVDKSNFPEAVRQIGQLKNIDSNH